ncbi:hypothetical protein BDZ89DRAFT_1125788 [Hymenopellis radicata]|nr:hypothetical protein BDZ89DRAFT_1125788 [Hymenopellis radicata]
MSIAGMVNDEYTFDTLQAPQGVNDTALRTVLLRKRTGIFTPTFADLTLYLSYLSLSDVDINAILSAYPDDPSAGCPFDTGYGLLPSGLIELMLYPRISTFKPGRAMIHLLSRNPLVSNT